jgi:hypothetical protein
VLAGRRGRRRPKIGGMDRQTLRDWVIRFNEQGRTVSSTSVRLACHPIDAAQAAVDRKPRSPRQYARITRRRSTALPSTRGRWECFRFPGARFDCLGSAEPSNNVLPVSIQWRFGLAPGEQSRRDPKVAAFWAFTCIGRIVCCRNRRRASARSRRHRAAPSTCSAGDCCQRHRGSHEWK